MKSPTAKKKRDLPLETFWNVVGLTVIVIHTDGFELFVGLLHIVVHDNQVVGACFGIGYFSHAGSQTLLHALFRLRASSAESGLEIVEGWRTEKDEETVERRVVGLDQLHALAIDVQDASSP